MQSHKLSLKIKRGGGAAAAAREAYYDESSPTTQSLESAIDPPGGAVSPFASAAEAPSATARQKKARMAASATVVQSLESAAGTSLDGAEVPSSLGGIRPAKRKAEEGKGRVLPKIRITFNAVGTPKIAPPRPNSTIETEMKPEVVKMETHTETKMEFEPEAVTGRKMRKQTIRIPSLKISPPDPQPSASLGKELDEMSAEESAQKECLKLVCIAIFVLAKWGSILESLLGGGGAAAVVIWKVIRIPV